MFDTVMWLMEAAWAAAGRPGLPRWVSGSYFALGPTAEDDALPARFAEVPIVVEGKERRVSRQDQERMKQDYYRVRGWDAAGRPTPELLRSLRVEESKR